MPIKQDIFDVFSNAFQANPNFEFIPHDSSFVVKPVSVNQQHYRKHFFGFKAKWIENDDGDPHLSIYFLTFPRRTPGQTGEDFILSRGLISMYSVQDAHLFVVSYLAMFSIKSKV